MCGVKGGGMSGDGMTAPLDRPTGAYEVVSSDADAVDARDAISAVRIVIAGGDREQNAPNRYEKKPRHDLAPFREIENQALRASRCQALEIGPRPA